MRLPFINRHARWREMASLHAAGALDARETVRFERHAAECGDCRALVTQTRELRAMLGALPGVEAPRSFQLTPAMAEREHRAGPHARPGYVVRGAQLAAGFAAAALAVVVVVDVVPSDDGGSAGTLSAPAARDAAAPVSEAAGAATAEASPGFSSDGQATGTSAAPTPAGTAVAAGGSAEASPTSSDGGVSGAGIQQDAQPTMSPAPDKPSGPPATGPGQDRREPEKAASPADEGGRTADTSAPAVALHEANDKGGGGDGFRIAEAVLGGLLVAAVGTWAAAWLGRRRGGWRT